MWSISKWTTKCHLQDDGNIINFFCDQDEGNWSECKNVQTYSMGVKGKHSQDSQVEFSCWEWEVLGWFEALNQSLETKHCQNWFFFYCWKGFEKINIKSGCICKPNICQIISNWKTMIYYWIFFGENYKFDFMGCWFGCKMKKL
jgi:hypothetical protein